MQENHLKPNEEGYQDNPQDLLNSSLIFARTLGFIFKEGEGIVIDIKGEVKLGDDTKKLLFSKVTTKFTFTNVMTISLKVLLLEWTKRAKTQKLNKHKKIKTILNESFRIFSRTR